MNSSENHPRDSSGIPSALPPGILPNILKFPSGVLRFSSGIYEHISGILQEICPGVTPGNPSVIATGIPAETPIRFPLGVLSGRNPQSGISPGIPTGREIPGVFRGLFSEASLEEFPKESFTKLQEEFQDKFLEELLEEFRNSFLDYQEEFLEEFL